MSILRRSAVSLARGIAAGELSSTELIREAIAQVDKFDGDLNAVVWRNDDDALAAAAAADAALRDGREVGPFHGVPIPIKELTEVADQPCTLGSLGVSDVPRERDDLVVGQLRRAGFVLFGRTNSPEAGPMSVTENRRFGVTRNPWSLHHSPAGSSGGAAVAVAAGYAPAAQATDGGGSIRMPASATGLVGLKPSRSRVPSRVPSWENSITDGVITRHVEDAAAILDAISVPDPRAPYSAPPPPRPFAESLEPDGRRLRIGIQLEPGTGIPVDPDCQAAAVRLGSALEELGHIVTPVVPRQHSQEAIMGFLDVVVNGWLWITPYEDAELAEPFIRRRREIATQHHAGEYTIAAARLWDENYDIVSQWGRDFDLLLTPTMATPPPLVGTVLAEANTNFDKLRLTESQMVAFTAGCNITGLPAISLPVHRTEAGLPVGAQLIGAPFGEAELLRVAAALEPMFGWTEEVPTALR